MTGIGIIDTGVLIGFTIEQDQHHENCTEYVIGEDHDSVILPPTAKSEFDNIEENIRDSIAERIIKHRHKVQKEVDDDRLNRDGLEYIRDVVLSEDDAKRAYSFLYKHYSDLMKSRYEVYLREIIEALSNMETEVWVDQSEKYGGWISHIQISTETRDSYSKIESELLIHEGDDPQVCLDAHHISLQHPNDHTELATPNCNHFIHTVGDEAESREDNILRVTNLDEIVDTSGPLRPTT